MKRHSQIYRVRLDDGREYLAAGRVTPEAEESLRFALDCKNVTYAAPLGQALGLDALRAAMLACERRTVLRLTALEVEALATAIANWEAFATAADRRALRRIAARLAQATGAQP